jgi:putative addiction module CopG family antidote
MTVHVPTGREAFVHSLVDSGHYTSEDAVVNEALRLLQEREQGAALARHRPDIADGGERADHGDLAFCAASAALACIRSRQAWADY